MAISRNFHGIAGTRRRFCLFAGGIFHVISMVFEGRKLVVSPEKFMGSTAKFSMGRELVVRGDEIMAISRNFHGI